MERTTFFDHYQLRTGEDDSAQPVSRTGPAINYDAFDARTKERVVLQLISRATADAAKCEQLEERARNVQKIDHVNVARVLDVGADDDYIGLVSEYVDGETAESWLVAHGPMPADAVLRIALQVVRALGAAAFFGLTHRAIQPSNIMIVRGQTVEGGWPFIKLINFGLAGLEIYESGENSHELAPTAAPQFTSPEQLLNKPTDFRSEMYSLGATMCFLLTGAVPLAVGGMKARLRARRLPELRRAPRSLRSLLVHMLRENPENRPQDPVAFEAEIRACLSKVERRQALGRKLGLPLANVVPRAKRRKALSERTPAHQIGRGILAFAALLLLGGVVAAFLLPEDALRFHRRSVETIGVPVGVPSPGLTPAPATVIQPSSSSTNFASNDQSGTQNSVSPPAAQTAPAAGGVAQNEATQPGSSPIAVVPDQGAAYEGAVASANASPSAPLANREAAASAAPVATGRTVVSKSAAQSGDDSVPPAEGPANTAESAGERGDEQSTAASGPASAHEQRADDRESDRSEGRAGAPRVKKKPVTSAARQTAASSEAATSHNGRSRRSEVHARLVGTTPDGRMVMRLPSGRTVIITPGAPDQDVDVAQPRRRIIERREVIAPYQPFDPGYPRD